MEANPSLALVCYVQVRLMIVVNIDVMLARRKMRSKQLAALLPHPAARKGA